MKVQTRFVPFLLLPLALVALIGTHAPVARAQLASAAPVIDEFDVAPELVAGSRLRFTVEGSPGAVASVRISGIAQRIPLKEVAQGVYEGTYTVKTGDRITADSTAHATLKLRNRSVSSVLQDSLGLSAGQVTAGPPLVPRLPAIESFTVAPIEKIEPGADLEFAMVGPPGGQAAVSIEGLAGTVALPEVSSGRYRGVYTIRRADRIAADAHHVSGTLIVGGKTLRATLNQALTAAPARQLIRNLAPRDGETVAAGNLTSVSGTFDDSTGAGVDPKTVKLMVSGTDVTRNTVITSQFFNYKADLDPGAYTAVVSARDFAGNAVNQTWNFNVSGQARATPVPLEILSPQNNADIGSGIVAIRGRTAPDATVDLQVVGVSAIFGAFGVSQRQTGQSTRADGNGNFAFDFQPQTFAKSARYELTLTASKNGLSQIANLNLIQRQ